MPGKSGKQVGVNVVARFRPCDVDKHLKVSKHHKFEIMDGKSTNLKHKKGPDLMFHLDMIFNDTTSQEMMFQHVGEPIIRDVLHGYNGTIFAYGQTGSGKTHSLFGDMSELDSEQRGIIPRSCQSIFEHFQSAEDIEEVTIKCSFLEIYKEHLQDLLMPDNKEPLKIRENRDKTIYVQGIHEEYVGSFDDVFELLQIGFRNRVVASTLMNQQSSRSHCVLTLRIKQTLKGGTVKTSKVNFADLAGSEKVKKTGATGDLLEQAKAINQSLSALGNVISALTTKGHKHIPYRDSILTFLLQDALGGNTKTSLVVTCSSETYNYDETVSTLRFATRAKQMTNKVKVNKVMSVAELQIMIAVLKKKLGKANAIISRLQSLVKLMRSANYNSEEHGSQIDQYLSELAKVQASESPKKSKTPPHVASEQKDNEEAVNVMVQPQNVTEMKDNNVVEKADSVIDSADSDGDRSLDSNAPSNRMNVEMEDQMERLHSIIDHKDKEIEELSEEIQKLKAELYAHTRREETLQRSLSNLKEDDKVNEDGKSDDVDSSTESNEREKQWRQSVDEHSQTIHALKAENEAVKNDRMRLLLWNQELQKQLDSLLGATDSREDNENTKQNRFSDEEVNTMRTRLESETADSNTKWVDEHFEHQLGTLKELVQKGQLVKAANALTMKHSHGASHEELLAEAAKLKERSKRNSELKERRRSYTIQEHKVRAESTAIILHNLQQKLDKIPEMDATESRDLVDAAVTSIRCLLDSAANGQDDLDDFDLFKMGQISEDEVEEISLLKEENAKLIKRLRDMRNTWSAQLVEYEMMSNEKPNKSRRRSGSLRQSVSLLGRSKNGSKNVIVKPFHQKSAIKQSRRRKSVHREGNGFGLRKMIGYLSGALLQYFGQVAVLRGPLWVCDWDQTTNELRIEENDYKKVYAVLTKREILGYRSLLHAESDTKTPLFQYNLKSFVSVTRIEEMNVTTRQITQEAAKSGVFIVKMEKERVVFRAEGNLSREVWMDNLEALLKE